MTIIYKNINIRITKVLGDLNMKKIISIVLFIVILCQIVLFSTSCNNNSRIVGSWLTKDIIIQNSGIALYGWETKYGVWTKIVFFSDGTCVLNKYGSNEAYDGTYLLNNDMIKISRGDNIIVFGHVEFKDGNIIVNHNDLKTITLHKFKSYDGEPSFFITDDNVSNYIDTDSFYVLTISEIEEDEYNRYITTISVMNTINYDYNYKIKFMWISCANEWWYYSTDYSK